MRWPPTQDSRIRYAVLAVLDRGVLVDGPEVSTLEKAFADVVGVEHAVAVSSGTAAVTAALLAVGVKPGDRVVVPAFTFSGSVLPVLHLGAVPVFVDVDPRTFCLDPAEAAAVAFRVGASAIVLVHLHGYPVAIPTDLRSTLLEAGVCLIEDACQAPGARLPEACEATLGTQGAATAFSFNEKKQVFAGEGGIVVTSSLDIADRVRRLRRYGEPVDQPQAQWRSYDSVEPGFNWKLGEIPAAIARITLADLRERCELASTNATILTASVSKTRLIPPLAGEGRHAWHKYRVLCEPADRDKIVRTLRERGVPVSFWQTKILPEMPAFLNWAAAFGQTDYPHARRILAGSFVVGDEYHPLYGTDTGKVATWAAVLQEVCG